MNIWRKKHTFFKTKNNDACKQNRFSLSSAIFVKEVKFITTQVNDHRHRSSVKLSVLIPFIFGILNVISVNRLLQRSD